MVAACESHRFLTKSSACPIEGTRQLAPALFLAAQRIWRRHNARPRRQNRSSCILRDLIRRGIFTSVRDLDRKLRRYFREGNKNFTTTKWKYDDASCPIGPGGLFIGPVDERSDIPRLLVHQVHPGPRGIGLELAPQLGHSSEHVEPEPDEPRHGEVHRRDQRDREQSPVHLERNIVRGFKVDR